MRCADAVRDFSLGLVIAGTTALLLEVDARLVLAAAWLSFSCLLAFASWMSARGTPDATVRLRLHRTLALATATAIVPPLLLYCLAGVAVTESADRAIRFLPEALTLAASVGLLPLGAWLARVLDVKEESEKP